MNKNNDFAIKTKSLMEECFLLNFLEDYQLEEIKENINKYISKLETLLNGQELIFPDELYSGIILSKEFDFKNKFIKLIFDSDLEEETFKKVVQYCLINYSPSFIIMSMEQKDVKYLESILTSIKINPNKDFSADRFYDAFEAISESMGLDENTQELEKFNLKFEKEQLISALQKYLAQNEQIVNNEDLLVSIKINEYAGYEDYPLQGSIVTILINICGRENIGKFSPYLPFLPKPDINQEMFVEESYPITVMTMNKYGLLGKFPNLLSHGNIFDALTKITTAINESELPQIKNSEYQLSINNEENENITILFFSNTKEQLKKKDLGNLLEKSIQLYLDATIETIDLIKKSTIEQYNNMNKNHMEEMIKESIKEIWLDIIIPESNMKKPKKKI